MRSFQWLNIQTTKLFFTCLLSVICFLIIGNNIIAPEFWLSFIILLSVGSLAALAYYYFFISHDIFASNIYLNYIAIYSYFFAILKGLAVTDGLTDWVVSHTDGRAVTDSLMDWVVCHTDGWAVMDGLTDWVVCHTEGRVVMDSLMD